MTKPPTLILIGLRGSGKTTLGKRLAAELDRPFVDLDDETARLMHAPDAGAAIREHSLRAFRAAETRALAGVLRGTGLVLALGGGTPTAPGASDLIAEEQRRARVRVAYLRASATTLRERLAQDPTDRPPLLGGEDPLAEIERVLEQRDVPYRTLANAVIDVDGLDPELAFAALRDWADDT
ncbi:MAG: shikimate kinase 2 [Phycisphaeraceae bacterium]|nr:MAG: shikimate kinase 2 [Phycisphaeraceae bacterium]